VPLLRLDVAAYLSTLSNLIITHSPGVVSLDHLSRRPFLLLEVDACLLSDRESNCNFVLDCPAAW
jgi:hypothetical protein